MKKIALLHFSYPPSIGGVEEFIRQQAKILSSFGYGISVITGFGKEPDGKIKLVEVPQLQSLYNTNPNLYEKILKIGIKEEEFVKLSQLIEEKLEENLKDYDVVIVHNMLNLTHNIPFIVSFKNYVKRHPEKKYISWIHDHKYIGFDKVRTADFSLPDDVNSLLIQKIAGVRYVCISETLKLLLTKVTNLQSEEITVIPNGINIKEFLEIDDDIWEIIEKNNLRARFPIILSPVNIIERKNIEYSLDIAFKLKKFYPNLAYIITGRVSHHKERKEYYDLLINKIKKDEMEENVLFLYESIKRSLHKSEIHDFYSISDMIFYFSKSENFGLPLLEASLTKTPIFISNLHVFKEVGSDYFTYVDTEKKQPEEMAKDIVDYVENSKRIMMNKIVKEKYDLFDITKRLLVPIIEQ